MDRKKALMLCSFMLARGKFIGLGVTAAVTAAVLFSAVYIIDVKMLPAADLPVVIFLFVFGIIFFAGHTAFCTANSVSRKYRITSFSAVTAAMCAAAALLNGAAELIVGAKYHYMTAEFYRWFVTGAIPPQNIFAQTAENFIFYLFVTAFGGFIGGLRRAKGDRSTLLILFLAAVVSYVFAATERVSWLFALPAAMMSRRFTAELLYIILAAVFFAAAYKMTSNGAPRRKSKTKKIAAMTAVTMLLSGCDVPQELYYQYMEAAQMAVDVLEVSHASGENKSFGKKCFESIEIYGAKLALPMNVSDLPDDFDIQEKDSIRKSRYCGFIVTGAEIFCEDVKIARAEVMYPLNGEFEKGIIVVLDFSRNFFNSSAKVVIGGELDIYSDMETIKSYLGKCDGEDFVSYSLGGGRVITFNYYLSAGYPNQVTLSVVGNNLT